jgi:hypothetical protein
MARPAAGAGAAGGGLNLANLDARLRPVETAAEVVAAKLNVIIGLSALFGSIALGGLISGMYWGGNISARVDNVTKTLDEKSKATDAKFEKLDAKLEQIQGQLSALQRSIDTVIQQTKQGSK